MIRAVVFDLDGTLIYNHTNFMKMRKNVVNHLIDSGIPASILDPDEIIVKNMANAEKYAVEHDICISKLYEETGRIMSRIEMETVDQSDSVEGALDVLIALKNECYKIGILTRGSREYTEKALKKAELDIEFDAVICRDDYSEEESKPNPLAMTRAAENMGIGVSECLYLGDHIIDMNCAVSAGAQFIGVLTGACSKEDWEKTGADYIQSVYSLKSRLPIYL